MAACIGRDGEDRQIALCGAFRHLARGVEGGTVTVTVESAVRLGVEFAMPVGADRREGGELATALNEEKTEIAVLGIDTVLRVGTGRTGINDVSATRRRGSGVDGLAPRGDDRRGSKEQKAPAIKVTALGRWVGTHGIMLNEVVGALQCAKFLSMLKRVSLLFSLAGVLVLASCASQPPPHPGRKLKLETIRHDFGTVYLYREVDDPAGPAGH